MISKPRPRTDTGVNLSSSEQRDLVLSILNDFLDGDATDLGDWFDHVGFDISSVRHPHDLPAAWVGHYRRGRGYDVDRACNDLATWPPIAARVAFLLRDREEARAGSAPDRCEIRKSPE